ncbi:MAG: SDR family NAD(P)-dependent oxidoreductase [Granulosicoccus sp.]|nr:SDR family NAD(P)-dependent oxidoreductase [Granulosicoccus sp.]
MQQRKSIVLTGCSRGLGRALVPELIDRGHKLFACSRDQSAIAELQQQYSQSGSFRALDVCDEKSMAQWARSVLNDVGAPDLLINNAALINAPNPLWRVDRAEFEQLVEVNIIAVHTLIRCFLPAMIDNGHGVVVNLSSGWGRSVSAEVAPYCATKWAIEGMTKALAAELPEGMAAIALNPGVIDTDMLRKVWGEAAGHQTNANKWASVAAEYLLSLNAEHNGQSLTVPGT